jgi:hypothetical protein
VLHAAGVVESPLLFGINAAALVAAGLFSVIIFPVISLQLLRSSAQGPRGQLCADTPRQPDHSS